LQEFASAHSRRKRLNSNANAKLRIKNFKGQFRREGKTRETTKKKAKKAERATAREKIQKTAEREVEKT